MKISRTELQTYFAEPLPSVEELVKVFTFHSFEIDGVEGDVMDVKVLPNRAADCAAVPGVAIELASLLDLPLKDEKASNYSSPTVAVCLERINGILGSDFSAAEVSEVFRRLRFKVLHEGNMFSVQAPDPRTDIVIAEDVAEEVGRVLGYDRVPATELPQTNLPVDQNRFCGTERMKDQLVAEGFSEVSTQSFAKTGDVYLANPMDKKKPALRTSLESNLNDALARAKLIAPLVLAPGQTVKLFEIGTVFPKDDEHVELRMSETVKAWGDNFPTIDNLSVAKLEDYGKEYKPTRYTLGAYRPYSAYPFIVRDIAAWIPVNTDAEAFVALIQSHGGDLLVRSVEADRFEKEGKTSLAYRLIFQAMDRTLTDAEVNGVMDTLAHLLTDAGYEVR